VPDHQEDDNLLGHEQVHPDYLVAGKIIEAFDHDLLLETILPHAVTRPTNVLQLYCSRAKTSWYAVDKVRPPDRRKLHK
jgi:hypothetical protein